MTDRYAVFGNPVAHSKSPAIHKLFAEQTKQDITYDKQLVELGQFAQAAKKFFDEGGQGLNITVPFKLDAYAFADELSPRAKLAGAVNTLKLMPDGKIFGDNTDGVGMVRDITQNLGWEIKGKHILILGAGGAVRGVMGPLLEQNPKSIIITNRTLSKAKELEKTFNIYGNINTWSLETDFDRIFDLVINGTSASLSGDLPPLPDELVRTSTVCYDMMYGKEDTIFMKWAKKRGSQYVFDGLGMLVEQAAESFRIWRERRDNPIQLDTRSVIDEVRRQL